MIHSSLKSSFTTLKLKCRQALPQVLISIIKHPALAIAISQVIVGIQAFVAPQIFEALKFVCGTDRAGKTSSCDTGSDHVTLANTAIILEIRRFSTKVS